MTRILAGKLKGRALHNIGVGSVVRPTMGAHRLVIFDLIEGSWGTSNLKGGTVLDAFAGTGSFGFEALSRGARQAYFFEKDPLVAGAIQQIIDRWSLALMAQVWCCDALRPPSPMVITSDVPVVDSPLTSPDDSSSLHPSKISHPSKAKALPASNSLVTESSLPVLSSHADAAHVDIAFLDPPYGRRVLAAAIASLLRRRWIDPVRTLVIIQQDASDLDRICVAYGEAWCRHRRTLGRTAFAVVDPRLFVECVIRSNVSNPYAQRQRVGKPS